ncbi:MAG: calcium-binding protein [Desmonostoc vinosum HA7617-LM4]|jgi:Ca2+-binding RTX toxin-like protein|nr:calcium-binding protein [Desmonostoc vinosum HA7617-LM4]
MLLAQFSKISMTYYIQTYSKTKHNIMAINGTPTPGNDIINGDAANNFIDALAGDDTVNGNGGNDTLIGGLGNDSLLGAVGDDVLIGGEGNDSLSGDVFGGTGNDSLNGGAGDDKLNGGLGQDTLVGGAGNDTYAINSADATIIEQANEGNDIVNSFITYTLGANLERLTLVGTANINGTGNNVNNIILGNSGNNILSGLGGDDSINGLEGNDTLTGGVGNDVLAGGLGFDRVVESGDVNFTLTDTKLTGNGVDTLNSIENANLTGGSSDNILDASGFSGGVRLSGGFGNDQLKGGAKSSILFGGSGNDTLIGGAEGDSLFGDNGDDFIQGAGGNDQLKGGDGNDTLKGDAGDDDLRGENGNDVIDGGSGFDSILDSGNFFRFILTDTSLEKSNSSLTEKDSLKSIEQATLFGSASGDIMSASGFSGKAFLFGDDGNDVLTGGSGSDSLFGGNGVDSLNGFADDPLTIERDSLSGGNGVDFFVLGFNFGFGAIGYSDFGSLDFATITDFSAAQGDKFRVGGNALSEYSLVKQSFGGIGSGAVDTQIFRGNELIAVVQDNTDVSIPRDFQIFG